MLLRGLVKLLVVVALSAGLGVGLGLGLSALSGGGGSSPGPAAPTPTGGSAAAVTATTPSAPGRGQVSVRVLSAVLQPASTPSGRARQRARLSVRIQAQNPGRTTVTPVRPALLVAGARIPTNSRADGPGTRLDPLAPGSRVTVTLEFELAGRATADVLARGRASLRLAGRTLDVPVTGTGRGQ